MPLPEVFSWRANKTWIDLLVTWLISWLIPCYKIAVVTEGKKNRFEDPIKQRQLLQELNASSVRKGAESLRLDLPYLAVTKNIAQATKCTWVNGTVKVPQRTDILKEWGLGEDDKEAKEATETRPAIDVRAFLPAHMLPDDKQPENPKSKPLVDYEELDLSYLPDGVPIVVYFHGGGFTLGNNYMTDIIELMLKVVKSNTNKSASKKTTEKICQQSAEGQFVYLSVEYSLAPEYAFPVATKEILTVMSYLCETISSKSPIHVTGASAGGNLAIVAAMECHRRYPGRVKSAVIGCPMLNPACDTLSYFQNPSTSVCPPSGWLRWCWRAYLDLPEQEFTRKAKNHEGLTDMDTILSQVSNRTVWEASKWRNTSLERLINPAVDLPESLSEENAPRIIVTTNTADPLREDGVALVAALKGRKAKVSHHDHFGSHWFGTSSDSTSFQALADDWMEDLQLEMS